MRILVKRPTNRRSENRSRPCRARALGTASAVLIAALSSGAFAQPTAKRFELADEAKLVRVLDPQLSPDGRSIVIVVGRANYGDDRFDNELVLVDVADGARRVLTNGRKGVKYPRWSPNGRLLAFLAEPAGADETKGKDVHSKKETDKEPHLQIFVMPMDGGDPRQLTHAPTSVQQFAWRPDGGVIAFATADEPVNKDAIEKHDDAFEVGDIDFLSKASPTPTHIWEIDSNGGGAHRLTSGKWSVVTSLPALPVTPPPLSWSPDGKAIVFTRQVSAESRQAAVERTVAVADAQSGKVRHVTGRSKLETAAQFSPDGAQIAYRYSRDGDLASVSELWVAPASGGAGSNLTRALDRNLIRSIWMPDGKSLLVAGNDRTRVAFWIQPLDGLARRLDLGSANPTGLLAVEADVGKNGSIVFAGSESDHPPELYYMASSITAPKRLTDFNHEVASLALGRVESIEWESDGMRADGVLVYPPGFSGAHKYPLVLLIHGGPRWASVEAFDSRAQLLAAHGYVVFEPNYRGSDSLGNAFEHAIMGDAGDGPGRDVMAGITAIEKRGFIDPKRIAVSGWSYGGFMTTWLIGHYQVWRAAIAGAAVTDSSDEYNLSDSTLVPMTLFGGSPWNPKLAEIYSRQSPITYVANVKTPTLIISDSGDQRVPVTNSYKLYHALRDNGVPVKFIVYPVPGHHPGDPVRERDIDRRWLEWMDHYLR